MRKIVNFLFTPYRRKINQSKASRKQGQTANVHNYIPVYKSTLNYIDQMCFTFVHTVMCILHTSIQHATFYVAFF